MSEAFRDISPDAPELQPIISGLFAEYAARYGDYFSRGGRCWPGTAIST